MNHSIKFKEPFESKLKKLRVKRAFARNLKASIDEVNSEPDFENFIEGAFNWEATKQGHDFWEYISKQ